MTTELPTLAMLDICVPVHRRTRRLAIDGHLGEWPDGCRLPDLSAIDGTPGFAAVWMAWDVQGLYFALDVSGKRKVSVDLKRPQKGDAFFLWIDTRDVRDAMRAGRFCHHFVAVPAPRETRGRAANAWQAPIHRAREQAPICRPEDLRSASAVRRDGYSLELAIPAAALNGYEPSEFPRLGMTYMIADTTHGQQLWNVPPHLPFQHDPSTWAAIELVR
ncbi:MAG: hypothetical protein FJX74_09820 [Armatimonadetes bacterium]|nr:hypothetical protein [Armatimonadota bacterium]